MKVTVEEINPVKRALKIEVPMDVVSQAMSEAYADLKRRVKIPGFRPGKAPLSLLEQRFAHDVTADVIRQLVPDYYQRAIKQVGLAPVEHPTIEKVELKKDNPLSFVATVEIKPTIQVHDYLGLSVKRGKHSISEEDVEKTLEHLRDQMAQLVAYEDDHVIADQDFVLMDFIGYREGRPLEGGKAEGHQVQVGSKTLIPGFEEQLVGHRKGEEVKVEVTFPTDYSQKALAGQPVTFQVVIREAKKKTLPALDDAFAQDVGAFKSLEELRVKLKQEMLDRLRREEDQIQKQEIMKQLIARQEFEVPVSLVQREMEVLLARVEQRQRQAGTATTPQAIEKARQEYEPVARDRVKGWILLETIAGQEGIQVQEEEVQQAMERMATEMKMTAAQLKQLLLKREGSLEPFKGGLLQDKVLDFLLSKAVVEEGVAA
ncbi:MAG TPA: trigger factor [Nitrospiria bacterium]|jgi:trigger factor|nr:trigger factor [Nitrospiria bacterium]